MAKARWVVDGNIWTSSGVSAGEHLVALKGNPLTNETSGSDMALSFVDHLVGPQIARSIRGLHEISEHTQEEDPFAAIHGLV